MEEVFAVPDINDQAAPQVTITTIHKSKGLEFDTVILPSLSKPARADSKDLLMWTEWQAKGRTAEMHLLLAPYSINDEGPHYKYLRYLEGQRSATERSRLLYVAATRAVKKLVLTAQLACQGRVLLHDVQFCDIYFFV